MKRTTTCPTRRRKPQNLKTAARHPAPVKRQTETDKPVPIRNCYQCVFCFTNLMLWARTLTSGLPVLGLCANCEDCPGQVCPVPTKPCRNFRPKPLRLDAPEPPDDKVRYIPLTRGLHAIVDAEDYEALSRYKWSVQPSRSRTTFYAKRCCQGRLVLMHREIMKAPKGMFVDHINGNGLDNRRCNLRLCTPMQNSCNRSKQRDATNRFIGVQPCGRDTYQATVMHKGKTYRAGTYTDEVEAAKARDRLARELHGPFARLNFPPEDPPLEG